jgi:hypothetical protein
VIDADKRAFAAAFSTMAVATRSAEPDLTQMQVYFDALRHLDIEFVTKAATRLAREKFFPSVGAWDAAARQIERECRDAQQDFLRRLPVPLCAACSDTGWFDVGPGVTDAMHQAESRFRRCDCQALRRLELLGRSPWPALRGSSEPPDDVV